MPKRKLIKGAIAYGLFSAIHAVTPLRFSARFFWLLPSAGDWTFRREAREARRANPPEGA